MCATFQLWMRESFRHGWGLTNHPRLIFAYVELRLCRLVYLQIRTFLDTHIVRVTSKYKKGYHTG